MIICESEQNSPQWMEDRRGRPTASCFQRIVTSKFAPSKSAKAYMRELAGEIITGELRPNKFPKKLADRGHEQEPEARALYELMRGVQVQQVGFCLEDFKRYGASPDGLVRDDGGLEIKTAEAGLQIARIEDGWNVTEHHGQVYGCLLVTGRKWWDIMSYSPGLKPVIVRFERDEEIMKTLENELISFHLELKSLVARLSA